MTAAGCFSIIITLTLENKTICFIRTIFSVYTSISKSNQALLLLLISEKKHYYTFLIHTFSAQEVKISIFVCHDFFVNGFKIDFKQPS